MEKITSENTLQTFTEESESREGGIVGKSNKIRYAILAGTINEV